MFSVMVVLDNYCNDLGGVADLKSLKRGVMVVEWWFQRVKRTSGVVGMLDEIDYGWMGMLDDGYDCVNEEEDDGSCLQPWYFLDSPEIGGRGVRSRTTAGASAELTRWAAENLEQTLKSEINVGPRLSEEGRLKRRSRKCNITRGEPKACAKEEANQSEWRQGGECVSSASPTKSAGDHYALAYYFCFLSLPCVGLWITFLLEGDDSGCSLWIRSIDAYAAGSRGREFNSMAESYDYTTREQITKKDRKEEAQGMLS
ncbi:hypothetical protein QVD17_17040 [Tagetes erecta]|uniref:Uncharacterized protein n=1 Tax=Tagetes erecta TaxID=13708 RepID=A0AAD8KW31_TARER|nr:hypothetical protein QVD17_17040 [Tagetes erecta]